MKISEVSEQCDISADTLRYYEWTAIEGNNVLATCEELGSRRPARTHSQRKRRLPRPDRASLTSGTKPVDRTDPWQP